MHTPLRNDDSNSGYSILRAIAMEWLSPHAVLCGIAICSVLAGQSLGFRQDPPTTTDAVANESPKSASQLEDAPSERESEGNAYESAQRSLDWLSKSMQRVTDKLDSMSKKMDPSASQEEIERELKQAVREAFSELIPAIRTTRLKRKTSPASRKLLPGKLAVLDASKPKSRNRTAAHSKSSAALAAHQGPVIHPRVAKPMTMRSISHLLGKMLRPGFENG